MAAARDNPWEDLVLSILSVNQYSLEKTYSHIEGLRQEGLVEPENLKSWTREQIALRLRRAGFDRGFFMTDLFADRLASLGSFVSSRGIEGCEIVLTSTDLSNIAALLMPVKGIGPKVLENFFVMRGMQQEG